MPHLTRLTVRGYHLDVYRHVNNARYLEFLEEARWDYFDQHGLAPFFRDGGYGMAIVHIDIRYRRAALLGDKLEIETAFAGISRREALIRQTIRQAGNPRILVEADVTFMLIDPSSGRAISFPENLRHTIAAQIPPAEDAT
ncbi:thioesterase [Eikenella longinqua]|uniref:Thioesterase n=1 Tax=Eikenella longinqua TaxID=1795827 RepID=A0A1A9RVQ1_9NEIS|nr:thioesterase family protein [Eikenella longinqua]OAM26367.1 thioesterase [Eikenella longinqua]